MSALSASHGHISSQLLVPPQLQMPNVLTSIQRQGSTFGIQKTLSATCHKSRLASYLSSTSRIESPSRSLSRNLAHCTQSSHLPFIELPEPIYRTKVESQVCNMFVQLHLCNSLLDGTQPCRRCVHSRPGPPPLFDPLCLHGTSCPSLKGMFADKNTSIIRLSVSSATLPPAYSSERVYVTLPGSPPRQ